MRFLSLIGQTGYDEAKALQLRLVEERVAGSIPDTVLFLEHRPVITRGRGLQKTEGDRTNPRPRHMPFALPSGVAVEFADSERGGDLTYHGPGQLVVYPIVKLDGSGFGANHDVEGYLRSLERSLIEVLAPFGLKGESRADATGVWVNGRKVASMGIAVRKWVTYHGMAINVVNDLGPFHLISPCGFTPDVMAKLEDLSPALPKAWALEGWRPWLEGRLMERISAAAGDRSAGTVQGVSLSDLSP